MVYKVKVRINQIYEIVKVDEIEMVVPDGCEADAIEELAKYQFKLGNIVAKRCRDDTFDEVLDRDPVRIEANIIDKDRV